LKAIVPLALALATTAALAGGEETVVKVEPVFSTTTRTECATPAAGLPGWLGQGLGAVLGAAAGSQIGSGKGNTIATASGAVLGAQAGAAMAGDKPAQQECRQVVDRRLAGHSLTTDRGRKVFLPADLTQEVRQ